MRIAALYDIHGNLPALEAVIEDVRREGVDRIVIGGDVIPGPMPSETLAYLFDLDIPVCGIQGNGERTVLAEFAGGDISEVPDEFRPDVRWAASQLPEYLVLMLSSWQSTLAFELPALGKVLFCHATPRNDMD